jgi:hypothetical protein
MQHAGRFLSSRGHFLEPIRCIRGMAIQQDSFARDAMTVWWKYRECRRGRDTVSAPSSRPGRSFLQPGKSQPRFDRHPCEHVRGYDGGGAPSSDTSDSGTALRHAVHDVEKAVTIIGQRRLVQHSEVYTPQTEFAFKLRFNGI